MTNLKQSYETVLILSTKLSEDALNSTIKKFQDLIEANATLDSVDKWGKRKLAYLINNESEGYYILFNFTCESEFPAELDRVYTITDGVLRSLIIKKED